MNDSKSQSDIFYVESSVNCFALKMVAHFLVIILFLSVLFNSTIILVYIRYKQLITPFNVLILAIIILNLIGSILELPLVILTNFSCG